MESKPRVAIIKLQRKMVEPKYPPQVWKGLTKTKTYLRKIFGKQRVSDWYKNVQAHPGMEERYFKPAYLLTIDIGPNLQLTVAMRLNEYQKESDKFRTLEALKKVKTGLQMILEREKVSKPMKKKMEEFLTNDFSDIFGTK